jgi:uncharacterized surface protein with fasciclin (FAS1) repeats
VEQPLLQEKSAPERGKTQDLRRRENRAFWNAGMQPECLYSARALVGVSTGEVVMRGFATITVIGLLIGGLLVVGCKKQEAAPTEPAAAEPAPAKEASNVPPLNENNIVSIAIRSEDHTTLVAAIKAADYVTSVAASGPLTVFAPTNAAFDKLPEGTVDNLVKPENVAALRNILQYHVTTSALQVEWFKDGQVLSMANGDKATIGVKDGKVTINGANITASIPASNGIVHVIDAVLLPPE